MRFTTMDPMCEKYYHLSPYAYCGNNPVNAVDMQGDTITYVYNGIQYAYRMDGDNSGFYDKNGNVLDEPSVNELSSALKVIQSGKEGNQLLQYLCSSNQNIFMNIGNTNVTKHEKGETNITWNPTDFHGAGVDEFGGTMIPTYIPLAHELFHAKDYGQFGSSDQDIWFSTPKTIVRMSEYYTSINENKIRAEHGLPLRRYYSVYANGAPYKPSLIPIYSIMPISIWGNSKMSF